VVTDTSHSAGLNMHATILAYLFTIVEIGRVTVPLSPQQPVPFDPQNNVLFVQVRNIATTSMQSTPFSVKPNLA
jgi:exportin-1